MGTSADRGAIPGSARSDRTWGSLVNFQVPDQRRASLRYRTRCKGALGQLGRSYTGLRVLSRRVSRAHLSVSGSSVAAGNEARRAYDPLRIQGVPVIRVALPRCVLSLLCAAVSVSLLTDRRSTAGRPVRVFRV